ncbi:hypothetical protein [Brackiella oedipodis]|uniref:hypothetical protein n=1 Tax=Brackiella oedipodis TaxID=124225 RepID=UPI00048E00CC|nr:hypothetical protein [Brackiella oedipodis]
MNNNSRAAVSSNRVTSASHYTPSSLFGNTHNRFRYASLKHTRNRRQGNHYKRDAVLSRQDLLRKYAYQLQYGYQSLCEQVHNKPRLAHTLNHLGNIVTVLLLFVAIPSVFLLSSLVLPS